MTTSKRISEQDITGQRGVNLIERRCLEMGLLFRSEGLFDAGIDGWIEIRNPESGDVSNVRVGVQSKATTQKFTSETDTSFTYKVKKRDLDYWLAGNLPVILVVSRPETDEAYWVDVKSYFADPALQKSLKVTFSKDSDSFKGEARDKIVALAESDVKGINTSFWPRNEILTTNLLKLERYSASIFVAEAKYHSRDEIWDTLGDNNLDIGGEWHLSAGMIQSFYDLSEYPWSQICEVATVDKFDSSEWAESGEREKKYQFSELLRRGIKDKLWRNGVNFNFPEKLFYFIPLDKPERSEHTGKSATGRRVVKEYVTKVKGREYRHYRHNALRFRPVRYGEAWYVELTPTYFFTSDGKNKFRFHEQQLKGIKRLERNSAVRYQVEFWAHFLRKAEDLDGRDYPFIIFGELETFESEFGFNDTYWKDVEAKDLPKVHIDPPLIEE